MVSKLGVASGVLMTLGSSVIIGGFVLLGYAGFTDDKNSISSTPEIATMAVSAVMAILLGVAITLIGARISDENKETQEKAQQPVQRGFKSSKFTKDEGYKVSI